MIPLTEREAQGLLVALRNAVQEAAQFQQAVAGLSAQITQPADVATLVRGVTADVRVPLLLGESVVVALGLHSHVSSQVWCAEFANNLTVQLTVRSFADAGFSFFAGRIDPASFVPAMACNCSQFGKHLIIRCVPPIIITKES